jgi:ketosteroid isomerase-like protein
VSDAERGITALHDAWVAAVSRGDASALRDLVSDDYEVWANAAPAMHGPDVVVAGMAAALAKHTVEQRFERLELIVAGEWAIERGIERVMATPRSGGEPVKRAQRALLVSRRGTDGRWRYTRGMTCALPPGEE